MFDSASPEIYEIKTRAQRPGRSLPLTEDMLRNRPSGDLFGLTQNVGMGWKPAESGDKQFLILSTQGGLRAPDGKPIALGYHTGHWEIGLLVQAAADELRALGTMPFAGLFRSLRWPDARHDGMFDSLPYRNDAAIVFRRLIRSLPRRAGVLGIATCDKGLPAMMMALAGLPDLPCVLVPGGVTLAAADRARTPARCRRSAPVSRAGCYTLAKPPISAAAPAPRRAAAASFSARPPPRKSSARRWDFRCRTPRSRLRDNPSGATSRAVPPARCTHLNERKLATRDILTDASIHNAMVVHAAFGGSTNLLLHIPAIAHAAGLQRPTVDDWIAVNRRVPRLVDVLPNGPIHHPTVRVFLAGGVPEVMLHLRRLACSTRRADRHRADLGRKPGRWEKSERRAASANCSTNSTASIPTTSSCRPTRPANAA